MLRRFYYIPLLGILLITLVIGSLCDLQINDFLYSPSNGFGRFMAAVGEYPGYFFIGFFGAFLLASGFRYFIKEKRGLLVLTTICGLLGIVLSIFYQGKAIGSVNGYNLQGTMKILGYVIGAVILIPAIILGYISGKKNVRRESWQAAFAFLLALAITILIITLIKNVMHRPRYRFLVTQDQVEFKNWWQMFSGYKDCLNDTVTKEEFKSFPSGHVGTATAVLSLPYLPTFLGIKKGRKTQVLLSIIAIAYPLLLAFTRMLVGAHFMSDVSMGGIIGCLVFMVLHELVFRKAKQINYEI